MTTPYTPNTIETETQAYWETHQSFRAQENPEKEKFYCLSMFPYPSGQLHMGHVRNYTLGDVIARYQRMQGKNVLQPIGWDAFGLPAENAALKHNIAPAVWTYQNIAYMQTQFKRLGFAYDWSREIKTCQPDYYRWEQWLFLQLYKKGLAYKKDAVVNWDPVDQTVLANEQVIDGRGWRSGALVERRNISQWFLKITAYAEELLTDLDTLTQWPDQVKTMQRNWIGRSTGVEVYFPVPDHHTQLTVYTTRPDTLMGVTYLAIAPQHPLALAAAKQKPELADFLSACSTIQVAEAALATLEKQGVNSGFYARHPLTDAILPIWIANFVVMDYGTGAVMAVPAHDQRDFEFAQKYDLPIKRVIHCGDADEPLSTAAETRPGLLIDSGPYTNLQSAEATDAIIRDLTAQGKGRAKIHYRLRDWGVSRQRYWGTPIPIIYCNDCGPVPVPDSDLPVVLPEAVLPTGAGSPLSDLPEFYHTTCPHCHAPATRETDTFDTFVESSWYFARFACPDQSNAMLDERARYWTPVDQYVGGIEHAVLHLLYARFYHKVLRDLGLLSSDEPFVRLLTQGMVLKDGAKMSKSKGNIVDPQTLITHYGADTVRLFTIFAAPPEQSLEWSDSGVEGAYRFLKRLWSFAQEQKTAITAQTAYTAQDTLSPAQCDIRHQIHGLLKLIQFDYERLQFNTVISSCMKLFNVLSDCTDARLLHEGLSILLRCLSPVVPHITHHLWQTLGYPGELLSTPWPVVDPQALTASEITLIVQVNGKLRARIQVDPAADEKTVTETALAEPQVQQYLQNGAYQKIIVVPKRLVNIVTG